MRNKQKRKTVLLLQMTEQIHNLCLYRRVQRCNRFIRHQKLRLHRQCPCNRNALPLSAGQFSRIFFQIFRIQPHVFHLESGFLLIASPQRPDFLHAHRLLNNVADLHRLIQTGTGILKNHLACRLQHFFIFPELASVAGINPFIINLAGIWLINIHHTACSGRFSGTGFSYQSKNFSSSNLKRYIIDCLDCCFPGQWKNMGQMTHIQQNLMFHLCFLLSAAQPSVLSHPAARLPHSVCPIF